MGSLQRVAAYLGAFAVISWVMVALSVAQTANLPAAAPSDLQAAGPAAGTGGDKDANKGADLGDRLNRSSGIIRPPAGVDPGLTQPTPQTGSSRMPVIPPPGSAGGDIDPK